MGRMRQISISLLLQLPIFIGVELAQNTSPVVIAFQRAGIVPDAIPVAPLSELLVTYPDGVRVQLGNFLTLGQTLVAPDVSYPFEASKGQFFTLIFFDPDVPSRELPLARSFRHWLVVNIEGHQISLGQTLTQYLFPTPPPGTGPHRYVFVLYLQPSRLVFDELSLLNGTITNRILFSVQDFATKYNLKLMAGNFFFEQTLTDTVGLLTDTVGLLS